MKAETTTQVVFRKLVDWKLDKIKTYLVEKQGLDASYVDALEVEYKRFLAIILTGGVTTPASVEVDRFWQAHINHTLRYRWMCMRFASHYIKHEPRKEGPEGFDALCDLVTMDLYQEAFGEPPAQFWPQDARLTALLPARKKAEISIPVSN